MTLNSMYTAADEITRSQLADITKTKILPEYVQAFRAIDAQLKTVYLEILDGVKPENYYNEMIKYGRYQKQLKEIQKLYSQAAKRAGIETINSGKTAITDSYYLRQYALKWFRPDRLKTVYYLPQDLIDFAVLGDPKIWADISTATINRINREFGRLNAYSPQAGSLTKLLAKNAADDLEKIRISLNQSMQRGYGYRKASKSIRNIMESSASNALRVARTEGNRLLNAGAWANANRTVAAGVEVVRHWDATLDAKTRARHATLDTKPENKNGLWFISGDSAQFPGAFSQAKNSINCRCSTLDIVDGVTPEVRTGRNPVTGEYENVSYKSFDKWANDNNIKR